MLPKFTTLSDKELDQIDSKGEGVRWLHGATVRRLVNAARNTVAAEARVAELEAALAAKLKRGSKR